MKTIRESWTALRSIAPMTCSCRAHFPVADQSNEERPCKSLLLLWVRGQGTESTPSQLTICEHVTAVDGN